jgi:hypothetical protein
MSRDPIRRRSRLIVRAAVCIATATACLSGIGAYAVASGPRPFTWTFSNVPAGWSSSSGVLSYDGSSLSRVVAPVRLPAGVPFTVQARVRVVGPGALSETLDGAGLFVRQKTDRPGTDVEAGTFVDTWDDTRQDGPQLYWNGYTVDDATMSPGAGWHTYLLEVRGARYTLSVDGKRMARFDIPSRRNPVLVGVFSRFERVQIRNLSVRETSGLPLAGSAPPPLALMTLQLRDFPADMYFEPLMEHYDTNAEEARLRGVSAASLTASGRILGLSQDFVPFDGSITSVFDTVAAYTSATAAQAAMASLVTTGEAAVSAHGATNVEAFSATSGDASSGFTFETPLGDGTVGRFAALYLTVGGYLAEVEIDANADAVSDSAIRTLTSQLAADVATRIQQHG